MRFMWRGRSCSWIRDGLVSRDNGLLVQSGARTMRKLLLGIGALCMAGAAAPAFAQGWGGYSGYNYGRNYGGGFGYGGDYADNVREHVRACRQHERFHERLG